MDVVGENPIRYGPPRTVHDQGYAVQIHYGEPIRNERDLLPIEWVPQSVVQVVVEDLLN